MARFDVNHAGIRAFMRSDGVRDGLARIAEKVQDRAVQITAAEAVDTGLMAASWRIDRVQGPNGWIVRVWNSARSPEGHPYPCRIEWGFHHHRSGKHVAGRRILGRSLDAARI